jgi:hypothetical protein
MADDRLFLILHPDGRRRFKPRIWIGRLVMAAGFRLLGMRAEFVHRRF